MARRSMELEISCLASGDGPLLVVLLLLLLLPLLLLLFLLVELLLMLMLLAVVCIPLPANNGGCGKEEAESDGNLGLEFVCSADLGTFIVAVADSFRSSLKHDGIFRSAWGDLGPSILLLVLVVLMLFL